MSSDGGFSARKFSRHFPGQFNRFYVWGKASTDPLYPAIYETLKDIETPLLDVGCGMGLLAFYLREMGWTEAIHGVDIDAKKIAIALQVARHFRGPLSFESVCASDPLPPHSGSVTLLDILQYLPTSERLKMLRGCAERVAPNGRLIIRTGVQETNWRGRVTILMDRVGNGIGWITSRAHTHPTLAEIKEPLAEAGLVGEFTPLWGRTPFHNWLGVFRREDQGPSAPPAA